MKNKELIDKLVEFYLTQDPKDVARSLANSQIDLNRYYNYKKLGPLEADSLDFRTFHNLRELYDFMEKGPIHDLKLIDCSFET